MLLVQCQLLTYQWQDLVESMPATECGLWDLFQNIAVDGDVVAVLEQLGGVPRKDGRPLGPG